MPAKSSLFVLLLVLSVLAAVGVLAAPLRTVSFERQLSAAEKQALFTQFVVEHAKRYENDAVREMRFQIFSDNVDYAVKLQQAAMIRGDAYTSGITRFFDLTPEEFQAQLKQGFRGYKNVGADNKALKQYRRKAGAGALPDAFDWRTKGAVTPVKDQGSCGSCWAFSTVGNLEGVWALANKTLVDLSPQHFVDCDHTCTQDPKYGKLCDEGCNGGFQSNALTWLTTTAGVATEKSYPYKGKNSKCKQTSDYIVGAKITGWERIPNNETMLAEYLVDNGPIAVALDASPLQWYRSGIVSSGCRSQFQDLNHAVLLVGFGVEKETPFWLVKNSWSTSWGEHGYFRIKRGFGVGNGVCGIALDNVSGKV